MKTLKSIVVGLALGCNVLACGPDVNNYYGMSGSGPNGRYICDDFGKAQQMCIKKVEPKLDQSYAVAVANICREIGLTQECIDCVATAPCKFIPDTDHSDPRVVSPLRYCVDQGLCPPDEEGDDW